ncbi:hypothetical protein AOLI_G00176410 [Acnodon oligacanthus]
MQAADPGKRSSHNSSTEQPSGGKNDCCHRATLYDYNILPFGHGNGPLNSDIITPAANDTEDTGPQNPSAGFSDPLGAKAEPLVSPFSFTAAQSPIKSISIKISHATSIAVPRNDTFPLRAPAFLSVPSHKFPKHMRIPEAA